MKMRVHKEDGSAAEGKKISGRRIECGCRIRRRRREWIVQKRSSGILPGRAVVRCAGGSVCGAAASRRRLQARKIDKRFAVVRRRTIELQTVFALKHVVEDADATANAGLGSTSRTPGKSDAWTEIVSVGEVGTPRRSRVSGKDQAKRSIRKLYRLVARHNGKGSALRIDFRRAVFVAKTKSESKIASGPPLVLAESVGRFAANVAMRLWSLE